MASDVLVATAVVGDLMNGTRCMGWHCDYDCRCEYSYKYRCAWEGECWAERGCKSRYEWESEWKQALANCAGPSVPNSALLSCIQLILGSCVLRVAET